MNAGVIVAGAARVPPSGGFWLSARCGRRPSDVIYRQLVADAALREPRQAGPGGHPGATLKASTADLTPDTGSLDQALPGPAPTTQTRAAGNGA